MLHLKGSHPISWTCLHHLRFEWKYKTNKTQQFKHLFPQIHMSLIHSKFLDFSAFNDSGGRKQACGTPFQEVPFGFGPHHSTEFITKTLPL